MAGILGNSKKPKKVSLPTGWIEKISKKHPDKPFYFNENTGESRWSIPLDTEEVTNISKQTGRKRKLEESSDETFSESSDAGRMHLNTLSSNRLKLKAKSTKNATQTTDTASKNTNNDTPAMRLYREKLAQRKAAAETKKSGSSKATNQKAMKTPTSTVPVTLKRTRRSTSVISGNESVSSNCSTVSNTSSMGVKLKAACKPDKNLKSQEINKLAKIPKVKLVQTNLEDSINKRSVAIDVNSSTKKTKTTHEVSITPIKKNSAKERLENFRKSLSVERDKRSPTKVTRTSTPVNNNNVNTSPDNRSKFLGSPTSHMYKKTKSRLCHLENRVQKTDLLELSNCKELNNVEESNIAKQEILEKIKFLNSCDEEMDWEPIEEEKIMTEIHSIRYQLGENPTEKLSELSCNALQSVDNLGEKNALYIIIDTNVFLSNLPFVEEVRDSSSDVFGRPFIVIPWTVLQELDYIKDDKSNTRSQALKVKARKAVQFLNQHFASKHPRFLGQTPAEAERNKEKFEIECPDDQILQTCLQIKEKAKTPVLLSYDKNLCNKAMIHDIVVLSRDKPLETIYYLKAAETLDFMSNSLHAHVEESIDELSTTQKELLEADDIMEEGKAVLKLVLSEVVSKEMENLFGERWQMHVIIRPPWSVTTVLKCAIKHWMAAVSESFIRKTEPMLRDLQTCMNNVPEGGRRLQDAKFFLDKCNDIVQTLSVTKYPTLKLEALSQIDKLIQRCLQVSEECKNARFEDTVGTQQDACEVEQRAKLGFKVMEEIYAYARDVCGLAADALGLQCSFSFNKMHPFLTAKLSLHLQQDVGVNVNKLLQVLRVSLSNIDENMQAGDQSIVALYETVVNFSSDLNFDEMLKLTPLDLFCCLKLKKSKLEKGYEQLQELAIHFCRIANYQCK